MHFSQVTPKARFSSAPKPCPDTATNGDWALEKCFDCEFATRILEDATEFHKRMQTLQYQTLQHCGSHVVNAGRTAECETTAVATASDPQSKHQLHHPHKFITKRLRKNLRRHHTSYEKNTETLQHWPGTC